MLNSYTYVAVRACDDSEVREAYNNCVRALTDFRSYHFQLVTK